MTDELKDKEINCNCLFLGESKVGKTSIIRRYIENKFELETFKTVGQSFDQKRCTINNNILNVKLWDTAGQEEYHSITSMFLKKGQIFFLIFDITKKSTFEKLQSYWYKEICDKCKEIFGKIYI